jgi:hypothetical protein
VNAAYLARAPTKYLASLVLINANRRAYNNKNNGGEMSTSGEELLKSFDLLPETVKHEVASEILRRTFALKPQLDESELAALYAEAAEEDRTLAEEGIEDYESGLLVEDSE